jgi:hypothetical protein
MGGPSSPPGRKSCEPGSEATGSSPDDGDLAALAHELSEAATAVTNYIVAVRQLHSAGHRREAERIDGILDKVEAQLHRLRAEIQQLRSLIAKT